MTAREIILKALYEIDHSGMYTNVALKNAISNPNLLEIDRGFATEVILGVQKNKSALDYIIMKFSKVKIKKMSPWIKNILRMGVYQMYYMDRVPHSAACNESVKLAKRYGHSASSGFVNGVLRSVSRNIENIEFPSQDNILEYLEVVYSYPMWIVEKIVDQYGADEGEVILAEGNVSHPNTIRVNSLKTTAKELLEILKDEGIFCTLHDEIPNCLIIDGAVNIENSPAYAKGLYTLQNTSSMLASVVLKPQSGETVIDVCSAPGGKTTHIAELMKNKGKIIAFDVYSHKIRLVENAARRLGIDIIECLENNSENILEKYIGVADKVLADVPCSGLGVIHKKPDIKWRRKPEDIENLVAIQSRILEASSKYLKVGGEMVYSTCTILKEENQEQVEKFLENNSNFEKIEEDIILTHKNGGSGFYICKLKRNE